MRVRVLYFAGARDVVGLAEEERDLPAGVRTIADFTRYIGDAHPALAPRLPAVRFARNERFADASESLADGDVVAILPPVAGG